MLAITLNPGFVAILAGFVMLATPRGLRAPLMAGAAAAALWLLLDHEFGAAAAVAQMGLPVVLLNLDALNRIFGIALLIVLILLAPFTSARRNRYEDAAILVLAGAAVSALFVGDLVSFVAAAALAGLAAAWVVFCSPLDGAGRAGVRLLVWQGVEGLLFLVGVAFHLAADAESSMFARLDATSVGGAFIFAALMIRVGAPLAHVWLKDAVVHASPAGAVALSVFSSMLGVYALARLFPSEPVLLIIGCTMIGLGVLLAAAADDLRVSAAYGLISQSGLCVALIGVGSPLALAAAEGHAFAVIFAFTALQMVLGAVLVKRGEVRASSLAGLSRAMPLSAGLLLVAGLAAGAAPGFALYASFAVALEASGQWIWRWVWFFIAAGNAGLFIVLGLRPALAAFQAPLKARPVGEAPFTMVLGAGVSVFFGAAIGFAPGWLYGLMPANLTFQPYEIDRIAPHVAMLGAAGVAFILLRALGLAPKERAHALLDVDAFYRGPIADGARWLGVVMLRLNGAMQVAAARRFEQLGALFGGLIRRFDRPYETRALPVLQFLVVAALVIIAAWRQYL